MTSTAANPVVIVAPATDLHANAVLRRLVAGGVDAMLLDIGEFPDGLKITLGEQPLAITIGRRTITPSCVYLRDLALDPGGANANLDGEMRHDWRRTMAALRERSNFLLAMLYRWEAAGVPIYNPFSSYARITKPYQLSLLASAGLPVPDTRWTNDPEEVRRFAAAGRVIYKPVAGGAATRVLEASDLEDARLDTLRAAPVCFQELLPGEDLRIYVVDGEVVAALRIGTDAIDFRQNETSVEQFAIDDSLRDICVRATEVLGLRFTGMDVKLDAHDAPKILELNPSPMFLGFDQMASTDIEGALCAALVGHTRPFETRRHAPQRRAI